jgi:hypothetical protein
MKKYIASIERKRQQLEHVHCAACELQVTAEDLAISLSSQLEREALEKLAAENDRLQKYIASMKRKSQQLEHVQCTAREMQVTNEDLAISEGAPCIPEGDSPNNNYDIALYAQVNVRPSASQS